MSALSATNVYIQRAMDTLALPESLRAILLTPQSAVLVSVHVERDNGETLIFTGFRVQHNNARWM